MHTISNFYRSAHRPQAKVHTLDIEEVKNRLECADPKPLWELAPQDKTKVTESTSTLDIDAAISKNPGNWRMKQQARFWIIPTQIHKDLSKNSEVYSGIDIVTNEKIIAKTIVNPPSRRDTEIEAKFMDRLNRLTRGFTPRVYEITSDGKKLYMIMEKVEGPNLQEVLDQYATLKPTTIIKICEEILTGVGYLNKAGLLITDSQPKNFILDMKFGRVRAIDIYQEKAIDSNTNIIRAALPIIKVLSKISDTTLRTKVIKQVTELQKHFVNDYNGYQETCKKYINYTLQTHEV